MEREGIGQPPEQEKKREAPGVFPLPDDPMFQREGRMKDAIDAARRDYAAITPDDVENALTHVETIEKGEIRAEKRLPPESFASIREVIGGTDLYPGKAEAAKLEADDAAHAAAAIEAEFMEKYGIDLRADEQPLTKKIVLAGLKLKGEATDALKRYEELRTTVLHARREQRMYELGSRDAAAYAAIDGINRGLRKLESDTYHEFGVSLDEDANSGDAEAKFKDLMLREPDFLDLVRKYREAKTQLGRLEKENGIDEA